MTTFFTTAPASRGKTWSRPAPWLTCCCMRQLSRGVRNSTIPCRSLEPMAPCDVQRRRTDAELGLNAQQASGRRLYDNYCDRCHAPYSTRGRNGPGLKGVFKKEYLPVSGIPANDARVGEIIRIGRGKMDG